MWGIPTSYQHHPTGTGTGTGTGPTGNRYRCRDRYRFCMNGLASWPPPRRHSPALVQSQVINLARRQLPERQRGRPSPRAGSRIAPRPV